MVDGNLGEEVKKERQRSPNYPAVGLREAVERVYKLYREDGRAGAPPKLAAVHIGFKAPHGQAMSVLAALKRFGLVSDANGRVAPTHGAIEILNLPENDPRRQAALREAALGPPIYRELVEKHRGTGLPKRDVLEAEMITYKKFNPSAVKGFVTDFLDTLEYAGISVEDGVEAISGQESEVEGSEIELPLPSSQSPMRNPQRRQQEEGGQSIRQDVFSLDDGGEVTISWPVPLTQDMITDIKDWLRIVERKISRSLAEPKDSAGVG